ncbi:MAG: ROK family protein [Bacteroidota bacterium]
MKEYVVGIDIGGTNTVFGFVDNLGNCIHKASFSTQQYPDPLLFVAKLSEQIQNSIQALPNAHVKGIGIGAPNGNFYKGTIEFAPNLKWKGVVHLAQLFQTHFAMPVLLTNDANAAAIGEMMYGNAKGMKDFILITLGTGVGSGIVSNGNMMYGHDGFAGEIGHVIVFPEGRKCGCGRRGCLEAYCSAKGIIKTYVALLNSPDPYYEDSHPEITPQTIFELASKGDHVALDTFEYTGRILGQALANSVAYTSPEAIFLFGGIANAGPLLFNPIRKSLEENLLNIYKHKIKILPSGIKENDAAILGAASLIWNSIAKN